MWDQEFANSQIFFPEFGTKKDFVLFFFNQFTEYRKGIDIDFPSVRINYIPVSENKYVLLEAIYAISYNGHNHFTSSWESFGNEVIFDGMKEQSEVVE